MKNLTIVLIVLIIIGFPAEIAATEALRFDSLFILGKDIASVEKELLNQEGVNWTKEEWPAGGKIYFLVDREPFLRTSLAASINYRDSIVYWAYFGWRVKNNPLKEFVNERGTDNEILLEISDALPVLIDFLGKELGEPELIKAVITSTTTGETIYLSFTWVLEHGNRIVLSIPYMEKSVSQPELLALSLFLMDEESYVRANKYVESLNKSAENLLNYQAVEQEYREKFRQAHQNRE